MRRVRMALFSAVASAALAGCGNGTTPSEQATRSIAWARAQAADGAVSRTLPGRIEAPAAARVGFEVAGRIEALALDAGDRFDKGEVLARLEAHAYRDRVASRQAELDSARARLEQARSDFERQRNLYERDAVSDAALDRAREALSTARARVDSAEAQLRVAERELEETRLRAPFAGAVRERTAEAGERVAPGQPVLHLLRQGTLMVDVAVPETLVGALEPGQAHEIALPQLDTGVIRASVARVGAGADRAGLFAVELALKDPPPEVRPGMSARVRLELPHSDAGEGLVAIPVTAYAAGSGETAHTFVLDEATSRLQRREIEIARVEQQRVLVASGLEPGEIVAARGIAFLQAGEKVKRLGVGVRRFDHEEEGS